MDTYNGLSAISQKAVIRYWSSRRLGKWETPISRIHFITCGMKGSLVPFGMVSRIVWLLAWYDKETSGLGDCIESNQCACEEMDPDGSQWWFDLEQVLNTRIQTLGGSWDELIWTGLGRYRRLNSKFYTNLNLGINPWTLSSSMGPAHVVADNRIQPWDWAWGRLKYPLCKWLRLRFQLGNIECSIRYVKHICNL